MNVLDRIRKELKGLSSAEQAVGQLVLKDPAGFQTMPVSELARRAGVSSPSVVRFCRTLGYSGLSEFKLRLAASMTEGVPFVHQAVQQGDTGTTLIHKVVDNALHTLMSFKNAAPAQAIEDTAQALLRCFAQGGRLHVLGVGNSAFVAQDAQHKFFRMGCHALAHADGHMQIMAASLVKGSDCVLTISNSGRSKDLLDANRLARQAGAFTMAITASGSPLAQAVQIHIPADHNELYEQYSPMVSRLLHLCIVDILVTRVAMALGSEAQTTMARLKKNLINTRYAK